MRIRTTTIVTALVAATISACHGDYGTNASPQPDPPAPGLLKDITLSNLPSPYYHFEYDQAGRYMVASFASELQVYTVSYVAGRLNEMQATLGSKDRLKYNYDPAGRVDVVRYVNPEGVTSVAVIFTYDDQKLIGVERDRRVPGGFIIDKTMAFTYYPDGNLREITERRPAIDGLQAEATTVDRFEGYDTGLNVDGFGLIHDDFFDHLVLLPDVQLQKNNPARQIHTGDGINFTVDYTYTYDHGRPLIKNGDLTITNGVDAGRKFQTRSEYSFY